MRTLPRISTRIARRFLRVFDGEYKLAMVWQVHGSDMKVISSIDDIGDSEENADAVLSDIPGVLAGAKTADCVPVLIGDPKTGAFAAVHAGWRGTVRSIAAKTVVRLSEIYGARPADMIAAIGPAACGRNYEIGQDVIDDFAANFADSEKYFAPTSTGHALVDLHAANRDQLIASGLSSSNIRHCTILHVGAARSVLPLIPKKRKKTNGQNRSSPLAVIGRR